MNLHDHSTKKSANTPTNQVSKETTALPDIDGEVVSGTIQKLHDNKIMPTTVLQLQRLVGNQAVQRLLKQGNRTKPTIQPTKSDAIQRDELDDFFRVESKATQADEDAFFGRPKRYKHTKAMDKDFQDERMGADTEMLNTMLMDSMLGQNYNPENARMAASSNIGGEKTRMLLPDELSQFELKEQQVNEDGKDTTIFMWRGKAFDTTDMGGALFSGGSNRAVFVMTADGKIYAANQEEEVDVDDLWKLGLGHFRHSAFLRGAPVAAAGELIFKEGKLTGVTNQSGHYKPEPHFIVQILQEFVSRGVNLQGVEVELFLGGIKDPSELAQPEIPAKNWLMTFDAAEIVGYDGAGTPQDFVNWVMQNKVDVKTLKEISPKTE